jgi:hypothetical protein
MPFAVGGDDGQPAVSPVPQAVLEQTRNNDQPNWRRRYGLMGWPGLLRKFDRIDLHHKT